MQNIVARPGRRLAGAVGILVSTLVWVGPSDALDFVDSTRVNVLRQYDPAGNFLVPEAIANNTGGAIIDSTGGNDGSGRPDQWQFNPNDGTQNGTATFTLPGQRLVGSFRADFNPSHVPQGGFLLEGFTGSGWTTLTNVATVTGAISGAFTPQNVTALRYTVTGPGTGTRYAQDAEVQVFLAGGQTVAYDAGYNLLRDAGKVVSVTDSVNGGPWWLRTSAFGGSTSYDGNYFSGHVHGQNGRTFFALSLDQPTFINRGHLGWYNGQTWTNYQVYGSSAAIMPAVQSLSGTDVATLTSAGWTLQLDSTDAVQKKLFRFAGGDGPWRHLLVVWGGTGAMVEFEAFIPEPSTVFLIAAGGLFLLLRRR